MKKIELKVVHVPIHKIRLDPRNTKVHTDEQVRQIANSITEFGFNNPCLLDAENVLIAGEGRYLAANYKGMKSLPCIYVAHLSERQRRAYAIADNKISSNAHFDFEKLSKEIAELSLMDFDIDIIGFSEHEIDALLKDDIGILPDKSGIEQSEKLIESHYRKAPVNNSTAKEKTTGFPVVVTFDTTKERDAFIAEVKKRKLKFHY